MNWIQIQQRFRDIQQEIYEKDDSPQALAKLGIETLEGTATLLSAHSVKVESSNTNTVQIIEAKEGIIVCTGAKPKLAAERFPGLDTVPFVTYEEVWDLKELPKRLTVIGGGPVSSSGLVY
jgi:pyruvate/2-oxoglutarate dehydrogenase complex dihydrolipoamide dehydrogenase (E3) component